MSEWSRAEIIESEEEILRENDVLLVHQRELAKIAADKEVALYEAKMLAKSQRREFIGGVLIGVAVFILMAIFIVGGALAVMDIQ